MTWDQGIEINTPAYNFAIDDSNSIRVVAGPGTGKSFGLRKRVARLLESGVDPRTILAVTFTRTAAHDLKKEIHAIGASGVDGIVAKTLHSYCFEILNRNMIILRTGRYPRPLLSHEIRPMLYDIGDGFGDIKTKRNKLAEFEAMWARLQSETPGYSLLPEDIAFENSILRWLTFHRAMLYGEMIRETYKYLIQNPYCQERSFFGHVLVDEYQDLNKAEQAVVDLLASSAKIAIIGDDDQSIYSFKFAHPEGIREFPNTHENCTTIDFSECRRCPKRVVNMASRLISNNSNRTLGDLLPYEENRNGEINIFQFRDLDSEITGISRETIRILEMDGVEPQDVLILVPVKKIGYRIRDELVRQGISAKSYFRESVLSTDFANNSYSYFNLLANPTDPVSWRCLLGSNSQTQHAKSYKRIYEYSIANNYDILHTLELLYINEITIPYSQTITEKYREIKSTLNSLNTSLSVNRENIKTLFVSDNEDENEFQNLLISIVDEIGVLPDLTIGDWLNRIFAELIESISYPDSIEEFDHVRIMSLHASKGLSAKVVIVMSCIDELIPNVDLNSPAELQRSKIEEQRRLLYVAITRCKCSILHQGTLIISSFTEIPSYEAKQIGIKQVGQQYIMRTRASRFISDFYDTAPRTQARH